MAKKISGITMAIGFIIALGTAGASDTGTITDAQLWRQITIPKTTSSAQN